MTSRYDKKEVNQVSLKFPPTDESTFVRERWRLADCRLRVMRFCEAKHANSLNADNQAMRGAVDSRKRVAFTLAEVLITLAVIGVVAAMTLPSLIKNYQKNVTVQKLKKSYAMFQQVIKLSENDNGDLNGWNYDLSNEEFAKTYLLPYLNGVEKASVKIIAKSIYLMGKTNVGGTYFNSGVQYILPDGTYISVYVSPTSAWNMANLTLGIDLNGKTGPNRYGRDIFFMGIPTPQNNIKTQFMMYCHYSMFNIWWQYHTREAVKRECNPENIGDARGIYAGMKCGSLIELDGWKISDDYPW